MAKRKKSRQRRPSPPRSVTKFFRGRIADRTAVDVLFHGFSLQMALRKQQDPQPSRTSFCTENNICTVSIPCMLTKGGDRIGCGPTEVLNPKCPIVKFE